MEPFSIGMLILACSFGLSFGMIALTGPRKPSTRQLVSHQKLGKISVAEMQTKRTFQSPDSVGSY